MNRYSRAMRILELSLGRTQNQENIQPSASELIANSFQVQDEDDIMNVSIASDVSLLEQNTPFREYTDLEPSLPVVGKTISQLLSEDNEQKRLATNSGISILSHVKALCSQSSNTIASPSSTEEITQLTTEDQVVTNIHCSTLLSIVESSPQRTSAEQFNAFPSSSLDDEINQLTTENKDRHQDVLNPDSPIHTSMEASSPKQATGNPSTTPPASSSNEDRNQSQLKKKRKRCVDNWKQTEQIRKRERGEEYIGRKLDKTTRKYVPNIMEKRRVGERCECKPTATKNCSVIPDEERQQIFENVWQMTWSEKKIHVKSMIDIVEPAQRKSTSGKRKYTFVHHLMLSGKRTHVCKAMFLSTTGLKETWIRHVLTDNGHKDNNDAATATNSCRSTLDQRKALLAEFLDAIPKLPSHYRRKESSKIYLEPVFQSFSELYREFVSFAFSKESPAVGRTVFIEDLQRRNIAIYKPRNDRCDTCIAFENGLVDEISFNRHRERELRARASMVEDTDFAKQNDRVMIITMDLQAVLQCPRLNASALYYKTKLCVHNFTIFNNVTKNSHCYVWYESEGGLGANEFASCLVEYLQTNSSSFDTCIIFSDGCTYQNRNKVMAKALTHFSQRNKKTVIQKILEKGHTQMPVDSVHSVIERKLKNKPIYCPSDYVRYIAEARQNPAPYTVSYLDFTFFKDFQGTSSLQSIRPGSRAGDANVTDIRQIKYKQSGEILYQLDFSADGQWLPLPMKRNESTTPIADPVPLYSERLKIKESKFNDLQSLKTVVPSDFHSFYDNLPH